MFFGGSFSPGWLMLSLALKLEQNYILWLMQACPPTGFRWGWREKGPNGGRSAKALQAAGSASGGRLGAHSQHPEMLPVMDANAGGSFALAKSSLA
jgi:hypothetical protein